MALKLILEPIFEADFYPTSYGFRRGRSTLDALAMLQRHLNPTKAGPSRFSWVIEGDIKGCFDNVDHHALMNRVRRRIGDNRILCLLRAFLKAGVMEEGATRHPVAGTPQGGIISPLLANVYLTAIDERYGRWTGTPGEPATRSCDRRDHDRKRGKPCFYAVRYADDFIVLVVGDRSTAEGEKDALAKFLKQELHMELSQEKTLITDPRAGFEFLGYRVVTEPSLRKGSPVSKLRIPKTKLQLLRNRIRAMTDSSTSGQSLDDLLRRLNPIIAGWRNYYRYATGAWKDFGKLDWWLLHRIRRWLGKKYPKTTQHRIRRAFAKRERGTRWTWGGETQMLGRFGGPTAKYHCRGTKISNGWNDETDSVTFHPKGAGPSSGHTWTGELL
jgi:group II intron reverse transcriptase/maturase